MILDENLFNDVESLKEEKISPKKALQTLEKIKQIYENDNSGVLVAGFYHNFMKAVNEQINEIKNTMNIEESFNEDFDDVVSIQVPDVAVEIEAEDTESKGPAPGIDTGITDLLLSLINDENKTIQEYNSFKASLQGHEEFDDVINDIVTEEYNHVGMLQTLLKKISPNSVTIEQGEEEAIDLLDKEDEDSLEVNQIIGEIDDSFDNGFGGIYV